MWSGMEAENEQPGVWRKRVWDLCDKYDIEWNREDLTEGIWKKKYVKYQIEQWLFVKIALLNLIIY